MAMTACQKQRAGEIFLKKAEMGVKSGIFVEEMSAENALKKGTKGAETVAGKKKRTGLYVRLTDDVLERLQTLSERTKVAQAEYHLLGLQVVLEAAEALGGAPFFCDIEKRVRGGRGE